MSRIRQIRKRDGRIVKFDKSKISHAILKAIEATGEEDGILSDRLAERVIEHLESQTPKNKIPSVEEIQDIVEHVLMSEGYEKIAKAYILYRRERAKIREAKALLGVKDDLKLTVNAAKVLEKRYLRRDETGKIIETPSQMLKRVADNIAKADGFYGAGKEKIKKTANEFYEMMNRLEFLPNSPCLMNAGTAIQQLSACFVLPIEDSMKGIFETLKNMAIIEQTGGGVGFSFSKIRPRGSLIKTTGGTASGPVSFIKVYNSVTDAVKSGGKRRGANMGILRVDHPDIVEFIICKEKDESLASFNMSVAITDKFMKAIEEDKEYNIIDPASERVVNKLDARRVWDLIMTMAWKSGDPGVIFIDRINNTESNPTPKLGLIESTNPCGETPLLPYESCNLGSINLSKMLKESGDGKKDIDWDKLKDSIWKAVHFLDNVIDMNNYPLTEIEKITKYGNRKIGLGAMGFADMLIQLWIPYNSEEAVKIAEKVMKFVDEESKKVSEALAKKRGSFSNFKKSIWPKKGYKALRNAVTTTIAPTGTISLIAGCVVGDTLIHTTEGKIKIKDLVGKEPLVYSSGNESIEIKRARDIRKTREKAEVWRVKFDNDDEIIATPDHPIMLSDGSYKDLGKLRIGDSIRAFEKHIWINEKTKNKLPTFMLYMTNLIRKAEHIAIGEFIADRKLRKDEVVHHINGDRLNNSPPNLKVLSKSEHSKLHSKDSIMKWSQENCGKTYEQIYGHKKAAEIRKIKSIKMSGKLNHRFGYNLSDIEKNLVSVRTKEAMKDPIIRERFLKAIEARSNSAWLERIRESNKIRLSGKAPWNKGLTLDDPRVLAYSIKSKETKNKKAIGNHKVISIGFCGYEDVYNMEVEGTHNYVANGIVVHNCSSGIEPLFAISYVRNILDQTELLETNPLFEKISKERGFYSDNLMRLVARQGSIQHINEIPDDIKKIFVTAHDIGPEDHVKIQAAFQKHIDLGVSKTVNFPNDATVEDVEKVFTMAYKMGCKGITVYRDRSKSEQVLNVELVRSKIKSKMKKAEKCASC